MRALIAVRLSRTTDATTSPKRQLAACRELIKQRGYTEVGVAEDLDVSAGKTTPFDRPQLGDWLENRRGEFDVIVFYRMDRIVRRLLDLSDLIRWCGEHSVKLVSATEAFLDLDSPFGDVVALLVAKVAEMELAAISERNRSAATHNIRAGKYRGGMPPLGYLPQVVDGEWRLVQDPYQVQVVNEMVARVLAGEPLRAIAHDLSNRQILTARDRFAQTQGREVRGYEWHSQGMKRALTSPTLLGQIVTKGEMIRGDDGSPVVRSEPILTRDVFDRIGAELADRENRKEPTKRSSGLLLQVVFCGVCGRPAYRLKGGAGRSPRYRCASAQYRERCGNGLLPLADADDDVTGRLLDLLGDSERLERVWDSGSDHSAELAEVTAELVEASALVGTAAFRTGTPQYAALLSRLEALAARQERLTAESTKPAGWTWQPTGERFSDWWERLDATEQNVWLRSMGVKLTFDNRDGALRTDLHIGDLENYLAQLKPGRRLKRAVRQLKG